MNPANNRTIEIDNKILEVWYYILKNGEIIIEQIEDENACNVTAEYENDERVKRLLDN